MGNICGSASGRLEEPKEVREPAAPAVPPRRSASDIPPVESSSAPGQGDVAVPEVAVAPAVVEAEEEVGSEKDNVAWSMVKEAHARCTEMLKSAGEVEYEKVVIELEKRSLAKGKSEEKRNWEMKAKKVKEKQKEEVAGLHATRKDIANLQSQVENEAELQEKARGDIIKVIKKDWVLIMEELALLRMSVLSGVPRHIIDKLVALLAGTMPQSDEGQPTLMHWFAQHGRRDMIDFLFRHGCTSMLNWRDSQGRTPLFYAQRARKVSCQVFLSASGSTEDTNKPTVSRPSTLGNIPPIYLKQLVQVEKQGEYSVTWKNGYTILHWAAQEGKTEMAEYLLQLGLDPMAKDNHGESAVSLAVARGYHGMAQKMQTNKKKLISSLLFEDFDSD